MDIRSKIYQLSEGAKFGGLFTIEQCQVLAKKLMQIYDGNNDNVIENMEVCNLMTDAYRAINKDFKPSPTDTVKFSRVITRNSERANITIDDLERTCIRFFGTDPITFQNQNQVISSQYQQFTQSSIKPSQSVKTLQVEQVQRTQRPKWLEERLLLAKKLFNDVNKDQTGCISQEDVFSLLKNTCKSLGLTYEPKTDDVQNWIQQVDSDHDGKINYQEYEVLVIRCMEKTGYKTEC